MQKSSDASEDRWTIRWCHLFRMNSFDKNTVRLGFRKVDATIQHTRAEKSSAYIILGYDATTSTSAVRRFHRPAAIVTHSARSARRVCLDAYLPSCP